ncbi:MAG TPA: GNAT family N-acetyltransferase, partial [Herpetosiphonaceae bacterium]
MTIAFELERFTARPATMDDLAALTDLTNRCSIERTGEPSTQESDMRMELESPGFDLATDSLLIHDADGALLGSMLVWNTSKPHVNTFLEGQVRPDQRGQGIGSALLRWGEERARDFIDKAPAHALVTLSHGVLSTDAGAAALLRQQGFELTRHFWRMVAPLDGPPPAPQLPAGLAIRSYDPATELPAVLRATGDSFKDHWGYVEEPFEEKLAKWEQFLRNDENYDPALFFVATDGPDIAGVALCWKQTVEDPAMGWVGTLGVLPAWRRSGLGLALLRHAFGEFHARGQQRVGLAVDAASLTGATRLYEKAGMRVDRQW